MAVRFRRRMFHLTLVVIGTALAVGCDSPTPPETPVAASSPADPTGWQVMLMNGSDSVFCHNADGCALTEVQPGETRCLCTLDGLTANVEGGAGDPGPFTWPTAPGFPPTDWTTWVIEPGAGGPPPGDPTTACDPSALTGGCTWSATLSCPTNLARGTWGQCELVVNPSSTLDYVAGWTFDGESHYRSVSHPGLTWEGHLIDSGEVRVDFVAMGREAAVVSKVYVQPRAQGIWHQSHWGSVITLSEGGSTSDCTVSARPISGARIGWVDAIGGPPCVGQMLMPRDPSGYTLAEVQTGPNEGAWYVSSAAIGFPSGSQIHPGLLPFAATSQLSDQVQADACRSALGLGPGPVAVNFHDFNAGCMQVSGWGGFVPAVWAHERGHFEQARDALLLSGNNLYSEIEGLVSSNPVFIHSAISLEYERLDGIASSAASPEPTGNWTTPFWIWENDFNHVFLFVSTNF